MNVLLKYSLVLLLWVGIVYPSTGQRLECQLEIENKLVGVLMPIHFKVSIVNKSRDTVELTAPWNDYLGPKLQYKRVKGGGWVSFPQSNFLPKLYGTTIYHSDKFNLNKIKLAPNEGITEDFIWVPIFGKEELVEMYSKDEIRVRLINDYDSKIGVITSNKVKLTLASQKEEDRLATNWLLQKEAPGFMYEVLKCGIYGWGLSFDKNPKSLTTTESLIKQFPASEFVNWAKLHLAMYYYRKTINEKQHTLKFNTEKIKELLMELDAYSNPQFQALRRTLLSEIDPFYGW